MDVSTEVVPAEVDPVTMVSEEVDPVAMSPLAVFVDPVEVNPARVDPVASDPTKIVSTDIGAPAFAAVAPAFIAAPNVHSRHKDKIIVSLFMTVLPLLFPIIPNYDSPSDPSMDAALTVFQDRMLWSFYSDKSS